MDSNNFLYTSIPYKIYKISTSLGIASRYITFNENGEISSETVPSQIYNYIQNGLLLKNIYNQFPNIPYNDITMLYYNISNTIGIPDLQILQDINELYATLNMSIISDVETLKDQFEQWYKIYKNTLELEKNAFEQLKRNADIYNNISVDYVSPLNYNYIMMNCKARYADGSIITPKDGIPIFDNAVPSNNIPFIAFNNGEKKLYKIYVGDCTTNNHIISDNNEEPIKIGATRIDGKYKDNIDNVILSNSQTDEPNNIYFTVWNEAKDEYDKSNRESYLKSNLNLTDGTISFGVKLDSGSTIDSIINRIESSLIDSTNVRPTDGSSLPRDIKLSQKEGVGYGAEFYIYGLSYEEITFISSIINDTFMKSFFRLEEVDKPAVMKKRLKLHYVGINPTNNTSMLAWVSLYPFISTSTQSIKYLNKSNEIITAQIPIGTEYIRVAISKAKNQNIVNEIKYLIPRMLKFYNDNLKHGYIDYYKAYIPEFGELINQLTTINTKKKNSTSNVKKLEELIPELFPMGIYSRWICQCQQQPIVISPEEIPEWQNKFIIMNGKSLPRQVLPFPPDNPKWYFVCNSDVWAYPGVKSIKKGYIQAGKKFDNGSNDELDMGPWTVCCFKKPQQDPLEKMNSRSTIKDKKNKTIHMKSNKNLPYGRTGYVSTMVNEILKKSSNELHDFYRLGTLESPNSLIHCILEAIIDNPNLYQNLSPDEKETLAINIRKSIITDGKVHIDVAKQELYDHNDSEIINQINNLNIPLDPAYHYRLLEEYFNINIFVFTAPINYGENDFGTLEIPRHKSFHAITNRNNRYSIIIYKGWIADPKKTNRFQCELIVDIPTPGNITKIFDFKMSSFLNDMIISVRKTINWVIDPNNIKITARKNIFSSIDYLKVMKTSPHIQNISYQFIDSFGKNRGFILTYSHNNFKIDLSVFFPPSQPENLPSYKGEPPVAPIDIVFELFGPTPTFIEVTNNLVTGIWYELFDIEEGLFLPIEPINITDHRIKNISVGNSNPFYKKGTDSIKRLKSLKRSRNILLQLFEWLFLLSKQSVDDFKSNYLIIDPSLIQSSDSNLIYNFGQLGYLLPHFNNIDDALIYLEKIVPSLVKNKKIRLYSEKLMKGLLYSLEMFVKMNGGTSIKIPEQIDSIYQEENDFKSFPNTYIFIKESDLRTWLHSIQQFGIPNSHVKTSIDFEYAMYKNPYIFHDTEDGKYYLIQSVINGELFRAINVAYTWYTQKINPGHDVLPFSHTDNNNTIINIPSYVLYEKANSGRPIPVDDSNKVGDTYLQIFKYESDKYAAMLPLL